MVSRVGPAFRCASKESRSSTGTTREFWPSDLIRSKTPYRVMTVDGQLAGLRAPDSMVILIALLMSVLFAAPSHGPEAAPSQDGPILGCPIAGPMALVAIDPDSDRPLKEYGLPDRSRERENEEEDGDGDESELPGTEFVLPTCMRPASSRRHGLRPAPETPPYL